VRLSAVRHDGRHGATLEVQGEAICGRTSDGPGALVLADDPTVSPRHARFRVDGGVLRVEDLGTENGTFVRLRVAPRRLGAGDEIRIGRQLLRVEPMPAGETAAAGGALPWGGPRGRARLRLVQLLEGGGAGEVFPLEPGEHIVGRDTGHVTFPDDRYVSARHALLTVSGDEVTIADAGSSNGTFVRISGEAELADGDELLVGGQLLRVGG
jgi:pSer/pThr/pTyr-binding forkhead associated (FHA) protein